MRPSVGVIVLELLIKKTENAHIYAPGRIIGTNVKRYMVGFSATEISDELSEKLGRRAKAFAGSPHPPFIYFTGGPTSDMIRLIEEVKVHNFNADVLFCDIPMILRVEEFTYPAFDRGMKIEGKALIGLSLKSVVVDIQYVCRRWEERIAGAL